MIWAVVGVLVALRVAQSIFVRRQEKETLDAGEIPIWWKYP